MPIYKRYFVNAHTAKGMIDRLHNNLQGIENIYVIVSDSLQYSTRLFQKLMMKFTDKVVEVLINIDDTNEIDGIIVRDASLAVIRKQIINTPIEHSEEFVLFNNDNERMKALSLEKQKIYDEAYRHFASGLKIHEQLEKIYINEMDFSKADVIIDRLINEIFAHLRKEQYERFYVFERFFATNTPDGIVNFMEPIVEKINKRYFLKGRAGTGKSYLIKKILEQCHNRSIPVEIFRCSLDPGSIDMIVIGNDEFAIFDATPPHELTPSRENDVLIDLYKEVVRPNTDEKYVDIILPLQKAYKEEMQLGLKQLTKVKRILENDKNELKETSENDRLMEEIIARIII